MKMGRLLYQQRILTLLATNCPISSRSQSLNILFARWKNEKKKQKRKSDTQRDHYYSIRKMMALNLIAKPNCSSDCVLLAIWRYGWRHFTPGLSASFTVFQVKNQYDSDYAT